jgi:hypothetical protein
MPQLKDFASSVAVVVSSCDAFFDTWRPFVSFFRKHWANCPFPIFLIVNELRVRSQFVRPLAVGPDRGWATNMDIALKSISQPYILYFQDDYFLEGPIRDEQLAGDFAYAFEQNAASFCFYARSQTEPGFQPLNDRFGIVPRDSDGRTRLQVTLWKKEVLQTILRPGETAWDMEARASERTRDLLCLSYLQRRDAPVPYLMSGIVRGLWTPEALALCQESGVEIGPLFRSAHSDVPWRRRFRRAVGRVRLSVALAKQRPHILDLDAVGSERNSTA